MQVLISSAIVLLLYAMIVYVIKLWIMFGMIVFLVRMYDGVNKEERNRILKLLIHPERGNVLTQKIKRSFMKMVKAEFSLVVEIKATGSRNDPRRLVKANQSLVKM
ncbi:unnamed protein product [Clavelina lepadiformis]